MKEVFQTLWKYKHRTWALKAWKLGWLSRSRLEPMKKVAKTFRNHLWGMINAVVLDVSNRPAESIKMIKIRARGFRNPERLKNTIYFYLGGRDLYPEGTKNRPTHS